MEEGEEVEQSLKAAMQKGYKNDQLLRLARDFLASVSKEEIEEALRNLGVEGFSDFLLKKTSLGDVTSENESLNASKEILEDKIAQLTPSQKRVMKDIKDGLEQRERKLMCIIGPGGTGKSYLINVIEELSRITNFRIKITATSASAAKLINGSTLHYLLGLSPNLDCRLEYGTHRWEELRETSIIIVDEISMMSERLLRKMDELLRKVAETPSLFGGKTILFFGDLLQLPPVIPKGSQDQPAFLSSLFHQFSIYELTESCRQRQDEMFALTLNRVRKGHLGPEDLSLLSSRVCGKGHKFDDSCRPSPEMVTLCAHRLDVDTANMAELSVLPGDVVQIRACDSREVSKDELKGIDQRDLLPDRLYLKPGARIMLTRNSQIATGLTNGTLATLLEIHPNFLKVKVDNQGDAMIPKFRQKVSPPGQVPFTRVQFPITLAWAITIHKCQGMTLQKVRIRMKDLFSEGQAYVALSRVQKRENLHLTDFDPKSIMVNQKALKMIEKLRKSC